VAGPCNTAIGPYEVVGGRLRWDASGDTFSTLSDCVDADGRPFPELSWRARLWEDGVMAHLDGDELVLVDGGAEVRFREVPV
jgi:hypothetical protein